MLKAAVLLLLRCSARLWAPLQLIERVRQKFFNVAMQMRLDTDGILHIHRSAQIAGIGYISIGDNFHAGPGLRLEALSSYENISYTPRIVIKDNVTLNDYVHIGANCMVELGNNVLIASKVFISDHGHGHYAGADQSAPELAPAKRPLTTGKAVVIEDNVWIGESVCVLAGVRIGFGSIIGANSVVTRDIAPYSMAVGAPARIIKRFNRAAQSWDAVGGQGGASPARPQAAPKVAT